MRLFHSLTIAHPVQDVLQATSPSPPSEGTWTTSNAGPSSRCHVVGSVTMGVKIKSYKKYECAL